MLYKKFHRDYIRRFKVGEKKKLYTPRIPGVTVTILRGPYIDKYSQICIVDNLQERCLFSHNGKKLQGYIEIVDDAIQEIS